MLSFHLIIICPLLKNLSLLKKLTMWLLLFLQISQLDRMALILILSKKYWTIIKQDFYNLCHAFHYRNICLQSLNGSYITLVPKLDGPTKVNDFRPISLLNISMKIITKLLGNRLQKVI